MIKWQDYSDDALLKLRFRDIQWNLQESDIYPRVQTVLKELDRRLPQFHPFIFIGDEWFSPEGIAAVSIPFFLMHPRLRSLEKKMMRECEGESEIEFERLLRHELGHAIDHAYKLSDKPAWRKVFGSPSKEYDPDTYRPRPYSKSYVLNLKHWYAQAHPDEDFAETFAVWMNPHQNWKLAYKKWSAIKKLEYVDRVMHKLSTRFHRQKPARMMSEARFLNSTLSHYYQKKVRIYEENYPEFFDKDLLRIFSPRAEEAKGTERAFRFMKRNEKLFISSIAHWTGEKKVTIESLWVRLVARLKELDLVVSRSETETSSEVVGFMTTLVSHHLFTGHFRRTV